MEDLDNLAVFGHEHIHSGCIARILLQLCADELTEPEYSFSQINVAVEQIIIQICT